MSVYTYSAYLVKIHTVHKNVNEAAADVSFCMCLSAVHRK